MVRNLQQLELLSGVGESVSTSHKPSRRKCVHSPARLLAATTRRIRFSRRIVFQSTKPIPVPSEVIPLPSRLVGLVSEPVLVVSGPVKPTISSNFSSSRANLVVSLPVRQITVAVRQSGGNNFSAFATNFFPCGINYEQTSLRTLRCVDKMQGASKVGLSLAPGFSSVLNCRERTSRFNGFSASPKAAEAAAPTDRHESPG